MPEIAELVAQLRSHEELRLEPDAPLRDHTRFGLGGPADLLIDALSEDAFLFALKEVRAAGTPYEVIGGGSNLVVADAPYRGAILRYRPSKISITGDEIRVEAGAVLQDLVNFACHFRYRESTFKDHKGWLVLSSTLQLPAGDRETLAKEAAGILEIRNAKYPPTMKCAGSIFKNLILNELPAAVQEIIPSKVVREGKVASAWFLEQVDAKGMRRGEIEVATYHANLIYNTGVGNAADVRAIIDDLKRRVVDRFGLELEEEVQFVGFSA
jgi:UDP-N-acetylenolpyruvoylglucosamine reductase